MPEERALSTLVRPLLRRWICTIKCHAGVILTIACVPPLAFAILAGLYYHRCAQSIDTQLLSGPFASSLNIYGSAIVLNDGDGVTTADLCAELRLAGFKPAANGKPGTFRQSPNGLNIMPFDETAAGPVRIFIAGDREIQRIDISGRDARTWNAGFPLIENLSPGLARRRMITFQDLPPILVNAVVSVEDKHFFHHRGLDLARILKAAWLDFRDRRKEQGASTITMQLVRGLWLEPEKRWSRKIAEAAMTVHLERKWTKEEIFAAYSNAVFLGRESAYSVHGFAEASQLYFGKDVRDLSLQEAALLAGMVQRPSYFNPRRNPEHAKERRDLVLSLMHANKYISADQLRAAVATPITLANPSGQNEAAEAPYFLDVVSDEVKSLDEAEGGAKSVYTTIDLNLQRAAGDAVRSGMQEVDRLLAKRYAGGAAHVNLPHAEAALIALDPHTGEIKAMVGGRDYAQSQLNRIFAKRPPGSVFKPFVYAAALNTGVAGGDRILTPSSTVTDEPTDFVFDNKIYRPANFRHESFGTLTLRQALARSDNVAAVKVAQMVGFQQVVSLARSAGLTGDMAPTPALALGSYAVTPFEMAGAYTVLANGGRWIKPQMVVSVSDANGETIRGDEPETHEALDPRVAYLITSMLQDVMRSGTAAGVRTRGFTLPAAGKTGTSHDGWFAGYTSQLLCIVWVGFDDYRQLDIEGAKSALPIWTEFMKRAAQLAGYRNAREFTRAAGIVSAKICLDSGKLAGDLCPRTTTDLFISGTEPQTLCDLHTAIVPVDALISHASADTVVPQP